MTKGMMVSGILVALAFSRILEASPTLELPLHGPVARIVIVGDVGDGAGDVAAGIATIGGLDAIVLTGDNVYPCGVWTPDDPHWVVVAPLTRLGVPIFPVLGNHDICGKASAQIGAPLANWHFPSRSYSVHSSLVDLEMLDTNPIAAGHPMPPLEGSFGTAPWRVAVGHHPITSSGFHGHFPRSEHGNMQRLRDPLRRDRVDLYACGHDHHLELIDGRPRMLISGAGSDPVPAIFLHAATLWPERVRNLKGFALVECSRTEMAVSFYDAKGTARSKRFVFAH